jgi:hypothetical protein
MLNNEITSLALSVCETETERKVALMTAGLGSYKRPYTLPGAIRPEINGMITHSAINKAMKTRNILNRIAATAKKFNRVPHSTPFQIELIWKEGGCAASRAKMFFPSAAERDGCYTALDRKVLGGLNVQVVK